MLHAEPKFGGETAFTNSQWMSQELQEQVGNVSDCAKGHVAYKPKMGDALMFYDVTVDYLEQDTYSMHTGCPVVEGVKWNAVKWIHGKPFRRKLQRGLRATKWQYCWGKSMARYQLLAADSMRRQDVSCRREGALWSLCIGCCLHTAYSPAHFTGQPSLWHCC